MNKTTNKIEAVFNYRNSLSEGESKPAFGLKEEDPNMPDHKSYSKYIENARLTNYNLSNTGFELLQHESKVKNFYDDKEISEIYYQEIISRT